MYNDGYFKIEPIGTYIEIKCMNCGKIFMCTRQRINKNKTLFCSNKCRGQYIKENNKNMICVVCGKKYHAALSHIKNYNSKYCSRECHYIAKKEYCSGEKNHQYGLKGDKNSSWKSDRRISFYGYILIRKLNHPFANCDDFVFEHRLVAEKFLLNETNSIEINNKRYLRPDYVVHHIDFDRQNNNINNLIVMGKGEHGKLHKKLNDDYEYLLQYSRDNMIDIQTLERNRLKYKIKDA